MDKSNYSFYTGLPQNPEQEKLNQGVYLWVLYADKIPPHVGISENGKYYSLKANGKDEALPVNQVLQVLIKKKVPVLFFDIEIQPPLMLQTLFEQHKHIVLNKTTCLSPITKALLSSEKDLMLSQLLEKLNSGERIKSIFGLHLKADFLGIPKYGKEEISKRISTIQDAKRSQHFFESH